MLSFLLFCILDTGFFCVYTLAVEEQKGKGKGKERNGGAEGAAFEPCVCFDISLFCPAIFSTISNQPPSSHSFHTIKSKKFLNTTRHYHIHKITTTPQKANIMIPYTTNNTFVLASPTKHPPHVPSYLPQPSTPRTTSQHPKYTILLPQYPFGNTFFRRSIISQ